MNSKKYLALFGLKWNPFSTELPDAALVDTKKTEQFCWKVENLVMDGGFAMITGENGLGKSVALRILDKRLRGLKEVTVGGIIRPQSGISDFYREMGELFGVDFGVSNRWRGFKGLREKWKSHLETTLLRSVLLIDEAQEVMVDVLSELRFLVSDKYDSRIMLAVVLCGDNTLKSKFKTPKLQPLKSRIRTDLVLEPYPVKDLITLLEKLLELSGNPTLMTSGLIKTIAEHSIGNPRTMTQISNEVLIEGIKREVKQLDEKLFLELYSWKNRK